jgi:hypothetical protein
MASGGTDKRLRYSLDTPVKGGIQWWEISDMKLDFAVLTVSAHFPDAEKVVRSVFEPLKDVTY